MFENKSLMRSIKEFKTPAGWMRAINMGDGYYKILIKHPKNGYQSSVAIYLLGYDPSPKMIYKEWKNKVDNLTER